MGGIGLLQELVSVNLVLHAQNAHELKIVQNRILRYDHIDVFLAQTVTQVLGLPLISLINQEPRIGTFWFHFGSTELNDCVVSAGQEL